MATFKELGLSEDILKALSDLGFETPTEIQEQSIPQLLVGNRDFIGLAQTGTGKTAAFGLPLLEQIDTSDHSTQGLVLAPTRELGQQIAQQLVSFSAHQKKLNVLAVYGGAAIINQIKALKRPQHIIIATPGRLIDLIKRKSIKLDRLRYLVLDEADEMLNMGFQEDIDKILSYTPKEKSTWLFSATMAREIKKIVNKYMDDPIEVKINASNKVNVNIEHQFVAVKPSNKLSALTRFLDMYPDMRGLVFCRTKRDTQGVAEDLLKENYQADALHGDLSQAQRDRVMKRFKAHDIQVLIATDVAARGIDVNDLTHVFHFNLPDDIEYYTHRSGRTARAGKQGISLVFISGHENYRIKALEKKLGISFEKVQIPQADAIAENQIKNWCQKIINQDISDRLNHDLIIQAESLFSDLSKEDIIAKIISIQLDKFSSRTSKDLNEALSERSGGGKGRSRGGRDRKGRYSRDRSGRGGRSGRDRKSRNDRSGNGGKKWKKKSNGYGSSREEDRPRRKKTKSDDSRKFGPDRSENKKRSKRKSDHTKSNGGKSTFKLRSKRRKGN